MRGAADITQYTYYYYSVLLLAGGIAKETLSYATRLLYALEGVLEPRLSFPLS